MHQVLYAVAILLFVGAQVCFVSIIQLRLELQCEVNNKLPENEKFEPLWWHISTRREFRKLHRRVLPESPRPRLIRRLAIGGFALSLSSIVALLIAVELSG